MKYLMRTCLLFGALFCLTACSTNPVTGSSEFSLVSESEEIQIGEENYAPLRQAQGGDYVADKALTAYVARVGKKLAKVSDRKLDYEFKVINDGSVNAWALPGGKISINRGLLETLENEAELAAVLGHEIVHAAARHSAQNMTRGKVIGITSAAVAVGAQYSEYSDYSNLIGATAIMAGNLVNLKYGRDAEREADYYGMIYMQRAGYDPRAAISLQQKFVAMKGSSRSSLFEEMFSSHPPSPERVDNNRSHARELGKGGDLGEKPYRKATARLKAARPAYDAFRRGGAALNDGKPESAERFARKAIEIEPDDNLFHLLLGDALAGQGKHKKALSSYDQAIKLSPDFYAGYEKRAAVKKKLGDKKGYKRDMKKSAGLLPTAVSYLALGQLAEDEGDSRQAMTYFEQAASADSTAGKNASRSLARLDRQVNPQNYIRGNVGLNQQGMVVVSLSNTLDAPVDGIIFDLISDGRRSAGRYRFDDRIGAGGKVDLVTDVGPMNANKFRKQAFTVSVGRARRVE